MRQPLTIQTPFGSSPFVEGMDRPRKHVSIIRTLLSSGVTSATVVEQSHVYGVGLSGALAPGSFALVAPYEDRRLINEAPRNSKVVLLRPGDVFAQEYPKGIGAYVSSLWVTDSMPEVAGFPLVSPYFSEQPYAEIVAYLEPTQVQRIAFLPTSGSALIGAPMATALPSNLIVTSLPGTALQIPAGTRTCTIHLVKSITGVMQRLDETYVVETYWLTDDRYWAHNETDDFDSSGLGEASAARDSAVFEIDRSVRAVYMRHISGGTTGDLYWTATFGW